LVVVIAFPPRRDDGLDFMPISLKKKFMAFIHNLKRHCLPMKPMRLRFFIGTNCRWRIATKFSCGILSYWVGFTHGKT